MRTHCMYVMKNYGLPLEGEFRYACCFYIYIELEIKYAWLENELGNMDE